jgi:AraC family transcriptional regulator of adaptative response / DNA-3-methyladenine glycosylase II
MPSYSAVVTTGIYCRPGCPARPAPRNVRPFATAAAAEAAGFRACLRCRPYRTEPSITESGPELVCRGVQMILDGALDGGTEVGLAARLGTSGRHLRRLFTRHLGVTPDRLARSRRAHFARRLLDDTDLTVTQIAFASGFGSVRQLNRECRATFRAAPGELRARRRRADRLVADGGLAVRLPYAGPLDWPATLRYLAARAIPGVEAVDGDVYRRTIVVDGDPGVLELGPGEPATAAAPPDHLVLHAHLPHWEGLIHLVERARRIAALDAPAADAAAHLGLDPVLAPLVAARPGVRPAGTWDPFEAGVRVVIGQQVSMSAANAIAGRLVDRLGDPVPGLAPFSLRHTFPTPKALVDGDLDGLGLTGARAAAVRAFAHAVVDGDVLLDRSIPLPDLVASITAVPGLGPWTAHAVAVRLGERDALPVADAGLRRAYRAGAAAVGAAEPLEVRSIRWAPWRAHAAAHLWAAC